METAITERVCRVREQVAEAARRAGRCADDITLVAVSKRHSAEAVRAAIAAGITDFGENYLQEAAMKIPAVGEHRGVRWHLIGGLQSNKARRAVELFDMIQSVDRLSLAQQLSRHAQACGKTLPVLIEVNLAGAEGRAGVGEDAALGLCEQVATLPALELCGLMGMAPWDAEPEAARPHFARLRQHFERLPERNRRVLSMGMSGDFPIAIEEGATLVRIGTALFGARPV